MGSVLNMRIGCSLYASLHMCITFRKQIDIVLLQNVSEYCKCRSGFNRTRAVLLTRRATKLVLSSSKQLKTRMPLLYADVMYSIDRC
eukprot:scaffold10510_cov84-Skeletonema_dohrnii-CCMP3373.AAC.11